jgi:hypothetical protein
MDKNYEELKVDDELILSGLQKVIDTINYEPKKVERKLYKSEITNEFALSRVDEKALQEYLEKDREVATYDCNVYKFNNINFDFLTNRISRYVKDKNIKKIGISGRIWYPNNGYMGWHTNSNNKGFRLYCTYARESNKSFFRYRDPDDGEIVTSWDKEGWNFRMFRISENLLWHCVYSETDRFRIGYSLYT